LTETQSRSLWSGLLQPSAYGIKLSGEVEEALYSGKPVVALESTIISHGMPFPQVSAFRCRHPTNQSDDPLTQIVCQNITSAPTPLPSPFSKFHPCLPAAHRFLGDFLQEMAHNASYPVAMPLEKSYRSRSLSPFRGGEEECGVPETPS